MRDGLVRAAHDVGEGGLVTAAAEMAIGGRLGVALKLASASTEALCVELFAESCGRLLLEVSPDAAEEVCARTNGIVVGSIRNDERFSCSAGGASVIDVPLNQLVQAWRGHVDATNSAGTPGASR